MGRILSSVSEEYSIGQNSLQLQDPTTRYIVDSSSYSLSHSITNSPHYPIPTENQRLRFEGPHAISDTRNSLMYSQQLTLAEFKALASSSKEDEESRLDAYKSHSDPSSQCEVFPLSSPIPRPRQSSVDAFLCADNYLSSDARCAAVYSKYDLNWTSLENYLEHWDTLSREDQLSLRALVHSDLHGNANRFGLKKLNLESHLLLSLGCDMTNIVNNGKDAISSNLLAMGAELGYSRACLDNRAVDPKTCLRAARKFSKEHSVASLFKAGFVSFQCVISSDDTYRKADREKYHEFFRENASMFARWVKRKKIYSLVYSHEVSVDSILGQKYRPHTHLIFFVPRVPGGDYSSVRMLEEEFNARFSDRVLSFVRDDVSGVFEPKVAKKFKDIERSLDYLHRCYSLADQYTREVRSDNIRELNRKTVETYHTLIALFRSESINGGVRRFKSSYIPTVKEAEDYKHPLLQKKAKSPTIIKLAKVSTETIQEHDTITEDSTALSASREDCQGNLCSPQRPAFESRMESSSRLGRIQSRKSVCSTSSRESASKSGQSSSIRSGHSKQRTKVRPGYASQRVCKQPAQNQRAGRCGTAKSRSKSADRAADQPNARRRAKSFQKHDACTSGSTSD